MKLFHVTDEPDRTRILSSGFDAFDCFVGDAGVVMWERPESRRGDATIEIELPDNVAGSYAHRRTAAVWGRASFYLVPVDVANAHLVRAQSSS